MYKIVQIRCQNLLKDIYTLKLCSQCNYHPPKPQCLQRLRKKHLSNFHSFEFPSAYTK